MKRFAEIPYTGYVCLGVVSLLSYNTLLECLGIYTRSFGDRFPAHSHVVYGMAATAGQMISVSVRRYITPLIRIHISLVLLCVVSLALAIIPLCAIDNRQILGLCFASGLGFLISVLQSATCALASASNPAELLNAFYRGQSLSGLLAWPLTTTIFSVAKILYISRHEELIATSSMATAGFVTLALFIFLHVITSDSHRDPSNTNPPTPLTTAFISEWPVIVLCWFTFVVSFTVYPRDLFKWYPLHAIDTNLYRSTLVYLAIVSDVVGMFSAPYIGMATSTTRFLGYARLIFIPIFFMLSSSIFPTSEYVHIIAIVTMSFSGGLILSKTMAQINSADDEAVGYLVSIALTLGIMIGSTIGSLIDFFL